MELKEYQQNALGAFIRWSDTLASAEEGSDKAIGLLQESGSDITDDIRNYPKRAWQKLAELGNVAYPDVEYHTRRDGVGRSIPHVCLKIPTGGGKTLLAASCLGRLRDYPTGLVLWLTPTKAIYNQTKRALWNKEHPYRQTLDLANGGRIKVLEKEDNFSRHDVANYLCIMLLSFPATNRNKHKEFLRIFRDSGRYLSFFPEDDLVGEQNLRQNHPDLEVAENTDLIKRSLYNVVKMLRPVVILDEAHKAYGISSAEDREEFVRSVNRLNPRMVLEFSATPHIEISNLLVDVDGQSLKKEEMIKLPVQVYSTSEDVGWKVTLSKAHDELERLDLEAQELYENKNRYIRPIAIVRVERTGKDQRDGRRTHAEDVREYLTGILGVSEESVRIQSSQVKELKNEDLLSELSPVRWIITKAALMEGWDCSFAYILVILDNIGAKTAITQLVGRVIRQPHAHLTHRQALDQSYVYCWNTDVGSAVQHVKDSLEGIGLGGLGDFVYSTEREMKEIKRRKEFREVDIFLPKVLHRDGDNWVELDYRRHILPEIDWDSIVVDAAQAKTSKEPQMDHAIVDVDSKIRYFSQTKIEVDKTVQISWFVRRLSGIIPNPWRASQIVQKMFDKQIDMGQTMDDIYDHRSEIASALLDQSSKVIESKAQEIFLAKLHQGIVRFDLETGIPSHRLRQDPYEVAVEVTDHSFERKPGDPIQKSLFEPIFDSHFDSKKKEGNFARYLDEEKALRWWHRVAARQSGDYYLRGWMEDRIWPDFIAMATDDDNEHLLIIETKGEQYRRNDDTRYKKEVFQVLEGAFNAGQMTVRNGPAKGTFRLVFNRSDYPKFDS